MNKKVFIAIPLCLIVLHGTSQVTAQDNCEPMGSLPACQGGGQININNNSHNVSPPNLCAAPGETIQVNVTPAGTSASIFGKSGAWPSASGTSFSITAPDEGAYNYNVVFDDGSCLDPRITIKR
ncbi:MAG: hypothetical protein DRR15_02825 [Gammaproteobacteria bacterium]|nr:MAG: hypothetical protein DRR15_02825 [Gammaproteobacteria bacterium]